MSTTLEAMNRTNGAIHDENNIKGFFGEYRFLSNFHPCNIAFEGLTYPSTENAYMAAKTTDRGTRLKFVNLSSNEAKKLGRQIDLRSDWEVIKFDIMYEINKIKYSQEPLKSMLLETGDKYLEETNWWGDIIWGVCNGTGKNYLGVCLMKIREELKGVSDKQLELDFKS